MVAPQRKWHFVTIALFHNSLGGVFVQANDMMQAKEIAARKYSQAGKHAKFFSFIVSEFPITPGVRYRNCMLTTTELNDLVKVRTQDEQRYIRIISGEEDHRMPGCFNCVIQDQSKEETYIGCYFLHADSYYDAREKCGQMFPFSEPAFVLASHGEAKVSSVYLNRLIDKAEYERMNAFRATHGMKAFNHMLESGATV